MRKRFPRLLFGVLLGWILIASGLSSDAVGLAESVSLKGVENAFTYTFTPSVNDMYAGYLFSAQELSVDHAELYQGDTLLTYQASGTKLFSARLNAETEYTLKIYGTGTGELEITRETLSRCFDNPLEMEIGGEYQKSITRSGDTHWYCVAPDTDCAALIAVLPMDHSVKLDAWLVNAAGEILAVGDCSESGACFLSAQFSADTPYFIRVFARDGEIGKYALRIQGAESADAAQELAFSQSQITLQGRSNAEIAAVVSPQDSCGLVAFASENPDIAFVSKDGILEGREPGETNIIAYAYGGATAKCAVTVTRVDTDAVTIASQRTEIETGESFLLNAKVSPENATDGNITYESSDESIATVDARGEVTAVGLGTVTITAANGSHSDSVTITVSATLPHYRALLIGEQNYDESVESVRVGSQRSVESIESLLKTARFNGRECTVTTLMDQPRDSVIAGIRSAFADATDSDVSILYITCHGVYRAGMTFFVMADGSVLSASDLERELREIPGEIVLLADCCGSGGLLGEASDSDMLLQGVTRVFDGAIGKSSLKASKYHVLASALLDQDSYRISFSGTDESDMATVFARAVCDALGWSIDRNARSAMNADIDYNGEVTFDEMTRYVTRRVKWYLALAGEYTQNAVAGTQGDMFVVFARSDT